VPESRDAQPEDLRQLVFHPDDDPLGVVAEWVTRPALRELVEAFGGAWPVSCGLEARLRQLVEFSEIWDHRKGGSRLDIGDVDEPDRERYSRVPPTADALGLVSQLPPSRLDPDHLVVLGGLAVGNLSRISYYRELAGRGLTPGTALVLLGSFRGLREEEAAVLRRRAPDLAGADSEATMLMAVARQLCPAPAQWRERRAGDPAADPRLAWLHAWGDGTPPVHVLAAPSSEPGTRPANTGDTLTFAAESMPFEPGDYVQLLTSGIYSVYQFFEAVRVLGLGYGVSVEVAGVPPERALSTPGPAAQAQEIRSCLRSALALARSAPAAGSGESGPP
jgi:hypothetical protein